MVLPLLLAELIFALLNLSNIAQLLTTKGVFLVVAANSLLGTVSNLI